MTRGLPSLVRPGGPLELLGTNDSVAQPAMIPDMESELPSERGETWNDTEAIACHRAMAPAQRLALAVEVSRAALLFAYAGRACDVHPSFQPARIAAALNR